VTVGLLRAIQQLIKGAAPNNHNLEIIVTVDRSYRDAVRDKYDQTRCIWDDQDRWHIVVRREIDKAVDRLNAFYPANHSVVIDVGAGGNRKSVPHATYVEVDIALGKLRGEPVAVCADAQSLPFRDNSADCTICVGPTVNYCSLVDVIAEISRVTKVGAPVLFHVELSNSLEFAFTGKFAARATFAKTFYRGEERLWLYSHRAVIETPIVGALLPALWKHQFSR
jgi:hypothetical protein